MGHWKQLAESSSEWTKFWEMQRCFWIQPLCMVMSLFSENHSRTNAMFFCNNGYTILLFDSQTPASRIWMVCYKWCKMRRRQNLKQSSAILYHSAISAELHHQHSALSLELIPDGRQMILVRPWNKTPVCFLPWWRAALALLAPNEYCLQSLENTYWQLHKPLHVDMFTIQG